MLDFGTSKSSSEALESISNILLGKITSVLLENYVTSGAVSRIICFTINSSPLPVTVTKYVFMLILSNYQLCPVLLKKVDTIGNELLKLIVIIKPNLITSHGERLIV